MKTSLKAAGYVFAVLAAFSTLAGVSYVVNWLCSLFLTPEQCGDDFWIRATFALIFIALASAFAFGLGMDWQCRRNRTKLAEHPVQGNTLNFNAPVYFSSEALAELTGNVVASSSTEESDARD